MSLQCQIEPGVLARSRRLLCIVIRCEEQPSAGWLAEQADSRMRERKNDRWWSLMPLGGGLILLPESLIEVSGRASYGDVMEAIDHGNESARLSLAELFPEYVAEALRKLSNGAGG